MLRYCRSPLGSDGNVPGRVWYGDDRRAEKDEYGDDNVFGGERRRGKRKCVWCECQDIKVGCEEFGGRKVGCRLFFFFSLFGAAPKRQKICWLLVPGWRNLGRESALWPTEEIIIPYTPQPNYYYILWKDGILKHLRFKIK